MMSSDDLDYGCDTFTHRINSVRERFNVRIQIKSTNKNYLLWFNEHLWKLMKSRDAALRKEIKTRRDTDMMFIKGLRNKVIQQLREDKSLRSLLLLSFTLWGCKGKCQLFYCSMCKM